MKITHIILSLFLLPSLAFGNSCPAGLEFDETKQKCQVSVETSQVANAARACQKITNKEAQRQCYEDAAKGSVARAENAEKISKAPNLKRGGNANYILNMLVGIYVIQYFLLKGDSCPAAWSVVLMGGGAITAFGGEISSSITYAKRLNSIKEEFQTLIDSKGSLSEKASLDVQQKSFLLLEKQEQNFREAAKWKESFYWASTAFYTGAAIASVVEIATMATSMGTAAPSLNCNVDSKSKPKKITQSSLEDIFPSLNVDLPSEIVWSMPIPEPDVELAKTWSRYQDWLAFGDQNNHETKTCTSVDQYERLKGFWENTSKEESLNFGQILLTGAHALKNQLSIGDAEAWYPCKTHPSGKCDTLIDTKTNGILYNKDKDRCEVKGRPVNCPPEALQKMRCRINALVKKGPNILTAASGKAITGASTLGKSSAKLDPFSTESCGGSAPAPAPAVVSQPQNTELPKIADLILPPPPMAYDSSTDDIPVVEEQKKQATTTTTTTTTTTVPKKGSTGKWWQKALASPWTRLAMAGTMGVMSGLSVKNIKEQIDASEKREAYIRKIRESIEGYEETFTCSTEDRNNPGKPSCYCYTEGGQRNPNRSNSQVCTTLANQRYQPGKITTLGGCLTSNGTYQSNCACKNSAQGNGCFRPLPSRVPISFQKATAMFGDLNSGVNRAFSDDPTFGSAQLSAIGQSATQAAARTLEKIKTNPKVAKEMKMVKKYEDELGEIQNRTLAYANSNGLSDLISRGAFTSGIAPSPTEKQDSSLDTARDSIMKDNPNLFSSPTSVESSDEPGFEIATESLEEKPIEISEEAKVEMAVNEAMKENFEYGSNDINSSSESLFDILSNRYQRSGLKKLFEENE